jgi:7,8-dihydropterin-6-yl-methyl-4-(beta-D-ribofuranosyl)aminobenzene 5'-phosphate synthase
MPAPEITELDALTLLVVVDNESDILSSVDPAIPRLSEVTHLLERTPVTLTRGPRDGHVVFDHLCLACHGLSVLVTARTGATARTTLFDVGPDGDVWLANAERLGADLAAIELVFLSHWHFDHSGGLPKVLAAIARARAAAGLSPPVLDRHPDRPHQRGTTPPPRKVMLFPRSHAGKHVGRRHRTPALTPTHTTARWCALRIRHRCLKVSLPDH